jgi:hypothetical protein
VKIEAMSAEREGCSDRLRRTLRRSVEIVTYDAEVPATQPRVVHVEIEAKGWGTRWGHSYTIGYRFDGPDPLKPSSWSYYGSNRWDLSKFQQDDSAEYEPEVVSVEEIKKFLARHNSSLEEVLEMYCQKLNETKTS